MIVVDLACGGRELITRSFHQPFPLIPIPRLSPGTCPGPPLGGHSILRSSIHSQMAFGVQNSPHEAITGILLNNKCQLTQQRVAQKNAHKRLPILPADSPPLPECKRCVLKESICFFKEANCLSSGSNAQGYSRLLFSCDVPVAVS
jgi:hypothetical protein